MSGSTKELTQTTNALADLLDRVIQLNEDWVKRDTPERYIARELARSHPNAYGVITWQGKTPDDRDQYIVKLNEDWLVIHTKEPDEHDFMRLDRALRRQIESRKLGFLIGTGSDLNAPSKLASVYVPISSQDRPMWFSGSHETEDAIALLKAYIEASETIAAKQTHADIK